jgi:hypothetical protein
MWDQVLGFLSRPVTAWVEGRESRKYMKEEGALAITKAKVALKVSKFEAEAERLKTLDAADSDYDKQAQMERRYTLADELLIVCVILLVGAHFFFPASLAAGWAAMGYTSAPWWLEFIIVGVFVSVFGLMRLFRAFNPFNRGKKDGGN